MAKLPRKLPVEQARAAAIKEGLARRKAFKDSGNSVLNDADSVRGRAIKEGLAKRKAFTAAGNNVAKRRK